MKTQLLRALCSEPSNHKYNYIHDSRPTPHTVLSYVVEVEGRQDPERRLWGMAEPLWRDLLLVVWRGPGEGRQLRGREGSSPSLCKPEGVRRVVWLWRPLRLSDSSLQPVAMEMQ